jgi:hypothetical protein
MLVTVPDKPGDGLARSRRQGGVDLYSVDVINFHRICPYNKPYKEFGNAVFFGILFPNQ